MEIVVVVVSRVKTRVGGRNVVVCDESSLVLISRAACVRVLLNNTPLAATTAGSSRLFRVYTLADGRYAGWGESGGRKAPAKRICAGWRRPWWRWLRKRGIRTGAAWTLYIARINNIVFISAAGCASVISTCVNFSSPSILPVQACESMTSSSPLSLCARVFFFLIDSGMRPNRMSRPGVLVVVVQRQVEFVKTKRVKCR